MNGIPVFAEIIVAMIEPAVLISASGALVLSNIIAEFDRTTDIDTARILSYRRAAIIREACCHIEAKI